MGRDVFISHASEDAAVAAEVCALLETRGVQCWIAPRNVAAGAVWDEAILDAIEQSRAFLLILSKSANGSQFVKNELNRAFSQNKPIVTFRVEEVLPGRSLELYLARHHWTDGFPGPLGEHVGNLADSITALPNGAGTPPAPSAPSAVPTVRPTLISRLFSSARALSNGVRTVRRYPIAFGVATLLSATLGALAIWNLKPAPADPPRLVTRTTINLPPGDQLAALDSPALAISPDGSQIAYVAIREGVRQIYLRALDRLEATPLTGTEGAFTPFFSPDGQWVGFFAGGRLKKVSVNGGAALTVSNAAATDRGASWSSQGTIAFSTPLGSPVLQVPDTGGDAKPLTRMGKNDSGQLWPDLLPSGQAVLFNRLGDTIFAQSLRSGEERRLVDGGVYPHYSASGHLLYVQNDTLMAAPFDPHRLQVTGAAIPIVEHILPVQVALSGHVAQYAVSEAGSLVYIPASPQSWAQRLVWVSRTGTEQVLTAALHNYLFPRIAPDGRQAAVTIAEAEQQLWRYDFARDAFTRLTFGGAVNRHSIWSPDGKRIAFSSTREGAANLFWQLADGSGGLERLTTSDYRDYPRSFSPDGQLLAYVEETPTMGYDIWVLHMSDRKAQPFLRTEFNESAPEFSPDGHWLTYVSDESGHYEVYAQPYPGPGGKYQISIDGGTEPVWNPNGKELFYRSGDKMMAVDVATQPNFSAGKPKMLFQGPYMQTATTSPYYDVSADGQRFLMIKPEQTSSLTQIVVVQNWPEELKQKVPTARKQ